MKKTLPALAAVLMMFVLVATPAAAQSGMKKIGVVITTFDGEDDTLVGQTVAGKVLPATGITVVLNPLQRALSRQEFNLLYAGDKTAVAKLFAASRVDAVMFIRTSCSFEDTVVAGERLVKANLGISIKTISRDGRILQSDAVMEHGAGFSSSSSLAVAGDHAGTWLRALLAELR